MQIDTKNISIKDIIERLQPRDVLIGNPNARINSVVPLTDQQISTSQITWASLANAEKAGHLQQGTLICATLPNTTSSEVNYLLFDNPRSAFQILLSIFFARQKPVGINRTAQVHATAKIGERVYLGSFVVVGPNCSVGDDCVILDNTVLIENCKVGNSVFIGANTTIGGVGFGYERQEDGSFLLIEHLGGVKICNNVDVGNNTCIDRGVLSDTIIGEGTKIDNLVHIAHNVVVGKHCAIIAHSIVGGSTVIGDRSWLAPNCTVKNGLEIGDDALIGLGAVITKNIPNEEVWVGNPGKKLEKK
jgi:UDP-3-O-[3-hydroxymyristoyl] glucosamine N-acyltransferase